MRIVAKVMDREEEVDRVDREDEVNTSDTSNKLGREPFARPTMGHGPLAGSSVKSFHSNISTRGTKTHVAGSRVSKNDARSAVGSSNTPFAFSKQNSSKAGSAISFNVVNAGNTPYANSKQSSSATKANPKKTQ